MITLAELNPHKFPTTPELDHNIRVLLGRLNKIRAAYGKPMVITSGLRSMEDHLRIYREKAKKEGVPFDEAKVPKKSRHLWGQAADVLDKSGEFYDWCKANEALLEEVGLWCEERMGPWQHLQSVPPKSGKRWFFP